MKPLAVLVLCALVLGCATSPAPSVAAPAASTAADSVADVETALAASGIHVAATEDTTPGDSSCIRGSPIHTFALYREPPDATYDPGTLPLELLVFASPVDRRAYEARISSDGSTITGEGCTVIRDYVATPHWYGAGRYLLQLVSDDPAIVAVVAAAASRLGSP